MVQNFVIPHSRPTLDESDLLSVSKVIRSGRIVQGEVVEKFEKNVAKYIGVDGAVAMNTGTSALHLSLLAIGIKEGDYVAMPSFVCTALLNAVRYVGAHPTLVDIDP